VHYGDIAASRDEELNLRKEWSPTKVHLIRRGGQAIQAHIVSKSNEHCNETEDKREGTIY
jgi:hypothetical protein